MRRKIEITLNFSLFSMPFASVVGVITRISFVYKYLSQYWAFVCAQIKKPKLINFDPFKKMPSTAPERRGAQLFMKICYL
jgi:hypothetical protein